MQALKITNLTPSAHQDLVDLYQTTKLPRIRTRAQMILLSVEQALKAPASAVRSDCPDCGGKRTHRATLAQALPS